MTTSTGQYTRLCSKSVTGQTKQVYLLVQVGLVFHFHVCLSEDPWLAYGCLSPMLFCLYVRWPYRSIGTVTLVLPVL